ncbi:ionotropic receptor 75a-like, partial [Athalia rosae]|uniref:ionotropic receptor 75a-like n=1 Tax=Athalia rosae TaxID=37344 RepID=UPI0020345DBA
ALVPQGSLGFFADPLHEAYKPDNIDLTKILNNAGISLAILYPGFNFSLETVLRVADSCSGIFLDLNCGNSYSEYILTECSKYGVFNESYNWLVFGKDLEKSIRLIDDESFAVTTDFVIVTSASNGYNLYDIYNHGKKYAGKLNVTRLAFWQENKGLNVSLVQEKYRRRANFHGMKLKVICVTPYKPDNVSVNDYLQDYTTRQLDSMSKFTYAAVLHVADVFNFTMEIVESSFWDQIDSDGNHLGMVGMLHRGEADLGASPAVMSHERADLTKLLFPLWPFRSCFMFRSITTRVSDEFIRPFTLLSWMITGLMIIVYIIILGLTFKIEVIEYRLDTWNEAILAIIGVMCQQGSTFVPKCLSGRLAIMNVLIFSLLIYNYYSASLVSAQLNMPLDKMNDSLNQLADSKFEVAFEPITYVNHAFKALQSWDVKQFYKKRWEPLSDKERFMPLEEGFERVAKGGFAYHTDPNTGYPYVERLFTDDMICELTEVHLYPPQKLAVWGKHNSPFSKIIQLGMTKLSSAGLLTRQVKRWAARKPVCFRENSVIQSVSVLSTGPMFLILCTGIVLASAICILENLFFKFRGS